MRRTGLPGHRRSCAQDHRIASTTGLKQQSADRDRAGRARYRAPVITALLGAPGSGKSTVAPPLAARLPAHVVLDWDAFMDASAALAGREISQSPDTWPAYCQLVRVVLDTVKHLPVVLLGVCTPAELAGWPVDAWVVLDCTDQERRGRLAQRAGLEQAAPER
jgi:cytidylate kinase